MSNTMISQRFALVRQRQPEPWPRTRLEGLLYRSTGGAGYGEARTPGEDMMAVGLVFAAAM